MHHLVHLWPRKKTQKKTTISFHGRWISLFWDIVGDYVCVCKMGGGNYYISANTRAMAYNYFHAYIHINVIINFIVVGKTLNNKNYINVCSSLFASFNALEKRGYRRKKLKFTEFNFNNFYWNSGQLLFCIRVSVEFSYCFIAATGIHPSYFVCTYTLLDPLQTT